MKGDDDGFGLNCCLSDFRQTKKISGNLV